MNVTTVRPRMPRQRRWPAILVVALVVLAIVFTVMSTFYVDLLWYREVGLSGVFWTTFWSKVVLTIAFGLVFFALLVVNLWIVRRISPTTIPLTPDQEAIERIRGQIEPYLRYLVPLGAGVLALLVGIGASRNWQTYLLWRNSAGLLFGDREQIFNRDAAFYVFDLPWLRFVQGWLFSALVGVLIIVTVAHVIYGGIRPQAPAWADKVIPPVRAHLSVLLGLLLLVKAWGYFLGRFVLLGSPRGVVQGASYTDVNAQLPALNLLTIAAVICAVLFFVNARVRIWALPIAAVLLLAGVSVLLGAVYPAFVQRFRVAPQEFQQERPYIAYNIEHTRRAFDLADVEPIAPPLVAPRVSRADLEDPENAATLENVRLWRPDVIRENYNSLQRFRQYYEFPDVDVDRYAFPDGSRQVLMMSGREVSQDGIPGGGGTWQNRHLVYTHGFGVVAAEVSDATADGAPKLTVRDVPLMGLGPLPPEPSVEQPRIYYGEENDVPFVVVDTKTEELDYEGAPPYRYDGAGGIPMGNYLQRALFAWRFRDINLLISSQITAGSRIMINRQIQERAYRPAPFLGFDADPYLAVVEGELLWIWDAYTVSDQYPYSESVDLAAATDGLLGGSVNYMRNAVKVVTNAYTGHMTYYYDDEDPIVLAWQRAFPEMFDTPIDQAPESLQAHFRYPENLLQVQATQFANYHVTDPQTFYNKQDFWQIPSDPPREVRDAAGQLVASPRLRPYYLMMKLPTQDELRFRLILPFVPEGRQNMVAWMSADSDPGTTRGSITVYEFPPGQVVDGPSQVFSQMNQDTRFSAERTLLGQSGSDVLFGDFLAIPIGDAFLYVEPVYVRAEQENAIPELKRVLVASGGEVGIGNTLIQAVDQVLDLTEAQGGGTAGGGEGGGQQDGGALPQTVEELLAEALEHFAAADEALRAGDLSTYQQELILAQSLVEQAQQAATAATA